MSQVAVCNQPQQIQRTTGKKPAPTDMANVQRQKFFCILLLSRSRFKSFFFFLILFAQFPNKSTMIMMTMLMMMLPSVYRMPSQPQQHSQWVGRKVSTYRTQTLLQPCGGTTGQYNPLFICWNWPEQSNASIVPSTAAFAAAVAATGIQLNKFPWQLLTIIIVNWAPQTSWFHRTHCWWLRIQ